MGSLGEFRQLGNQFEVFLNLFISPVLIDRDRFHFLTLLSKLSQIELIKSLSPRARFLRFYNPRADRAPVLDFIRFQGASRSLE